MYAALRLRREMLRTIMHGCGRSAHQLLCSVDAGAAAAELPLEQCCIDGRTAQKWWHICFGGRWVTRSIGDAKRQLCAAASCSDARECCVAESNVCAIAAGADLGVSDAVSAHIAPRNGGASVSGAGGVHGASETLSKCFALRHHAWM